MVSRRTIGIIGAVLGLIQVMKDLANIEEVGKGIAVAFVATVYWCCVGEYRLPSVCQQDSHPGAPGSRAS